MKKCSPEVVFRIARDEGLTKFFLDSSNAKEFKDFLQTLLGRETNGAEGGLVLDDPQSFVSSFNKRDQLLLPRRLEKIRQSSDAAEILNVILKRQDLFAVAVSSN